MEPEDDAGDVKEGAALAGRRGNTHAIEHDPAQGIASQAADANLAPQCLRDLRHRSGTHRSGQDAGPGQPGQPGAQEHDQNDDKNREAHAAVCWVVTSPPYRHPRGPAAVFPTTEGFPLLTYQDRDLNLSLHYPIGANHLAGEDIELHELAAFRGQAEGNELQQDVRILPVVLKQLDRLLQRGHRTRPRFLLDELEEAVVQGASRGNLLAARAHHQHGRTARVVPGDLDLDHTRRYRFLLKRPQGQAHPQPLAGREFTALHRDVGNCRRLAFACQTDLDIHVEISLRSEEHTSELQSLAYLVCRLLLEK